MEEKRMDFFDFQRQMADSAEDEGFTAEDVREQVKMLKILGFHIDRKGENIVSEIDGVIAFIDRKYSGETVAPGDIWLCSVTKVGLVYYAMPLRKITSSMIMGLSDEIREGIIETLWKKNRSEFVKIFEKNYKEAIFQQAYREAEEKSAGIVAELQAKVAELNRQVEHSRIVLGSREAEEDYIELGSEYEEPAVAEPAINAAAPVQTPDVQRPADIFNPVIGRKSMVSAPGMPEVRVSEPLFRQPPAQRYAVERVSEETIYCESFIDGKYFVHINPSKKFIVVRRHDYGSAICVGKKIRLDGLGSYSGFSGRCQLVAEYSPRYDGLLIYL